jgi:uracil-DNA glycosylase family 4
LRQIQYGKEIELTEFQEHCERWKDGCGAKECGAEGTKRVFARGSLPCDVLFVGEAPGESENNLATPFIGPAGKLLDQIIEQATWVLAAVPDPAARGGSRPWTWAMTNLVACIPRTEGGGYDVPTDEQVRACQPRLAEMITLARPRLIVRVGKTARDWIDDARDAYRHALKPAGGILMAAIDHPAGILRMNHSRQGLAVQRCVVTLAAALKDVFGAS